jgi:hypothetical protein
MMVLSALRPDASLPEFLANRARSASIYRLSIDVAVGVAGSSSAIWWRPSAWFVLMSVALILFAYGGWGLADRARSSKRAQQHRLLRVSSDALCGLLATAGALAAGGVLLGVWAMALGTWIS